MSNPVVLHVWYNCKGGQPSKAVKEGSSPAPTETQLHLLHVLWVYWDKSHNVFDLKSTMEGTHSLPYHHTNNAFSSDGSVSIHPLLSLHTRNSSTPKKLTAYTFWSSWPIVSKQFYSFRLSSGTLPLSCLNSHSCLQLTSGV